MLWRDVVPARDLRDDRARRKRFGHDPSLNLVAPPPAAPRTDLDIDPPPWLRTVDYMVNHICEPTCVRCVACCRSPRGRQCGAKKPLTAQSYVAWLNKVTSKNYRLLSEAEREYVTRAGTTTTFWWGNSISTHRANYNGTQTYAGEVINDY